MPKKPAKTLKTETKNKPLAFGSKIARPVPSRRAVEVHTIQPVRRTVPEGIRQPGDWRRRPA